MAAAPILALIFFFIIDSWLWDLPADPRA